MARYFVHWEVDRSAMPANPKDRIGVVMNLMKIPREETKIKEWGNFGFNGKGYCVLEGTEQDIATFILKNSPIFKFSEPIPALTVDQSNEVVEKLVKMVMVAPKQ